MISKLPANVWPGRKNLCRENRKSVRYVNRGLAIHSVGRDWEVHRIVLLNYRYCSEDMYERRWWQAISRHHTKGSEAERYVAEIHGHAVMQSIVDSEVRVDVHEKGLNCFGSSSRNMTRTVCFVSTAVSLRWCGQFKGRTIILYSVRTETNFKPPQRWRSCSVPLRLGGTSSTFGVMRNGWNGWNEWNSFGEEGEESFTQQNLRKEITF